MQRNIVLVLSWAMVLAVCVMIFVFSGMEADDSAAQSGWLLEWITRLFGVGFTDFFIRKAAHMLEFAALGFFSCFAFAYSFRKVKHFAWGLLFSFVYAASDEIHQLFVPGRAGQVRDIFIDLAGAVIGALVLGVCYKLYQIIKNKGMKRCIKDSK
ncbi:MAG: VanZ family protein [Clostridia bacterium]|nr:VanZ family protein [Clostridia bacterium]